MEGKIDSKGFLYINRTEDMKGQVCPVITDYPEHPQQYCGDWCPLFGEPHAGTLLICQGRKLIFQRFTDERKSKGLDKEVAKKFFADPTDEENKTPVKKRRGRPPKVRNTYHEACKTCRKSRKDDKGKYPPCSMASFSTGSSGIESCALWWEKEGR